MRGSRRAFACGLIGALLAACGSKEPQVQPAAPVAANRPPEPPDKPVARFDLAGQLHVEWVRGSDPESPADQLKVEITLSGSPYSAAKDKPARFVFPPGATGATLSSSLADPIISVRTIDPQGLASATRTVASVDQAPQWISWPSGRPEQHLSDCLWREDQGLLCTGANGAILADADTVIPSGLRGRLRIAGSIAERPWLVTDEGRILVPATAAKLDPPARATGWTPLQATLAEPYPAGPIKSLQADAFGLTHLIDATGAVWIGDTHHLLRMVSPLATEDGCDHLSALGFSHEVGLAVCDSGKVFTVAANRAGMQWRPLTATTDPLPSEGILELIAETPGQAVVIEPTRIRSVAVGGWTTLIDQAAATGGIPLRIGRSASRSSDPNTHYIPTSEGLAILRDGSLTVVAGTPRNLVGVIARLSNPSDLTLIDADGTRFIWTGTELRSEVPPPLRADLLFHAAADLLVAVTALPAQPSDPSSLLRVEPPSGVNVTLRAGLRTTDGKLIIAGSEAGLATVWQRTDNSWKLTRLDADGIRPTEIIGLDQDSGANLIAISEHEVFRRADAVWSHHSSQPAALKQIFATGASFLLFADGATLTCSATACQPADQAVAAGAGRLQWHEGGGRWSLADDGTLRRLSASSTQPSWQQAMGPLPADCAKGLAQRLAGDGVDLLRYADGRIAIGNPEGCEAAGTAQPHAMLLRLGELHLVADQSGIRAIARPPKAPRP
jgi:hypothetical protein